MKIKAVLFDKDGTLFDFHATWGVWAASVLTQLSAGDPRRLDALARAIAYDLTQQRFLPHSCVIAGTLTDVIKTLLPHLPHWDGHALADFLNTRAADAPQAPAVDLVRVLSDLRGDALSLGVMTNDSEATARLQLDREAVSHLFDFIAGADSGYGSKPDPAPLLAFASAQAIAPQQVVMVGDSLHDLHAAKAAGMLAVGVLTGPASREDLAETADVVLPNIGALQDWLRGVSYRNNPI
ncbi:phosphatase [Thioclava sp. SK-1]|uniref:HAD family hydrolase n=1 Tax=Thioclava sp. SK-1 TaxID=1889770 RepID=UPI000824C462|nr:HAD family hydrolase [Thioclava sp. SK-1]OCX64552.1 phosphatase [Thioclava sp. SK-1]